jgi:hypothetical protein
MKNDEISRHCYLTKPDMLGAGLLANVGMAMLSFVDVQAG